MQAFSATQDSSISFSPTRQPPTDTVFGPMGASEVDTQETRSHASSTMVYSPSQLSTVTGDVDPIAEADVYLAYNRDVQAEEILKEAKRNAPKRTDIQVKLLEIYAKRQDMEAFDAGAQELHLLTDGEGDDWSKTRMLARDIGSAHSLFKVTGSAFAVTEAAPANQSAYNNNSLSFVPQPTTVNLSTSGPSVIPEPHSGTGLIDFDLSSLTLDLPTHPAEFVPAAMDPVQEDPKLALAEEYLSIGDKAGARALIEEVLQQSTHPQIVSQAHQMLARLG
jgi:pilus assembly protein FimV